MRLRHIEVFHAIMQAGTISGAAQVLHITQPAVTKVLQHCEMQLGMPLFERRRGKLYPRPEAHRLFAETEKLNRDLQGIRRLASSLKGSGAESVRVLSTPTLALSVLPRAVIAWHKRYPEAKCELATHHTREIVSALLLGEADFALSLHDPRHPGIVCDAIAEGELTVIASRGTWPAGRSGTPLPVVELPDDLIGLSDSDPLGSLVAAAFDAQERHFQPKIVVQTYQIARSLVEAGGGMAIVDPFTALSAPSIRIDSRPLAPALPVRLYVLSAAAAPMSQGARRLADYIGSVARECLSAATPAVRAA